MATSPLLRHLVQPRSSICQRCVRRQNISRQWRRNASQSKLREPEESVAIWRQTAEEVRSGQRQSMLQTLERRGFIKDVAGDRNALESLMTEKRVGAYVGVDPTAPSLHVGHLLPYMALFWMYIHGFNTIALIGGMTSKVGDPTGRSTAREQQTGAAHELNSILITRQMKNIWANVDALAVKYEYKKRYWSRSILNNQEWLVNLGVGNFLQDLGYGMRLGAMLNRDTVKSRMESGDGMSFAEFCYPLLQAWDWWTMYHRNDVQMQIGGSDQYGNICAGIDAVNYIRKSHCDPSLRKEQDDVSFAPFGFTTPLLTTSSGEKFGKSAGNAVWLDPDMLSSFDLYQYFMKCSDTDVEKYLLLLTFVPLEQVSLVMATHQKDASQRIAQHLLARELVELAHGARAATEAERAHKKAFREGTGSIPLSAVNAALHKHDTKTLSKEQMEFMMHKDKYMKRSAEDTSESAQSKNVVLPKSLVYQSTMPHVLLAAGLTSSISQGHTLVQSGGVYSTKLDNNGVLKWVRITVNKKGKVRDFITGGEALALRIGKSKFKICHIIDDEQFEARNLSFPGWNEWRNKGRVTET